MSLSAPIAVLARQDETVDALVWRVLGRTAGATEAVLTANDGLASAGARLPAGLRVLIPVSADVEPSRAMLQLWDAPVAAADAGDAPLYPLPGPDPQEPSMTGVTQIVADPALVWTVNHGLGYRPVVGVRDETGAEIGADIVHLDLNTVQITFTGPTAGSVRCV